MMSADQHPDAAAPAAENVQRETGLLSGPGEAPSVEAVGRNGADSSEENGPANAQQTDGQNSSSAQSQAPSAGSAADAERRSEEAVQRTEGRTTDILKNGEYEYVKFTQDSAGQTPDAAAPSETGAAPQPHNAAQDAAAPAAGAAAQDEQSRAHIVMQVMNQMRRDAVPGAKGFIYEARQSVVLGTVPAQPDVVPVQFEKLGAQLAAAQEASHQDSRIEPKPETQQPSETNTQSEQRPSAQQPSAPESEQKRPQPDMSDVQFPLVPDKIRKEPPVPTQKEEPAGQQVSSADRPEKTEKTAAPAGTPRISLSKPELPVNETGPESSEEKPASQQTAALSDDEITAKTALQWRYRQVPPDEPEPHKETDPRHEEYAGSTVDGARVRGKKHKHEGTNCDDWFETAAVGDITILAVSDGAGSRKLSRIGAREACRASAAYAKKELGSLLSIPHRKASILSTLAMSPESQGFQTACGTLCRIVQDAVLEAQAAVRQAQRERSDNPAFTALLGRPPEVGDFAATLLLAVIVPVEARRHLIITCQVGDGMVATVDTNAPFEKAVRLLGEADSGDFSGETEFITSSAVSDLGALQSRTKVFCGNADIVLAMTDGVADDYYPNAKELPRLYYDLVANGILDTDAAAGPDQGVELPEPVAYPWVNNPTVKVPLNYSERIQQALNFAPEELWDKRRVFAAARAKLPAERGDIKPQERLERWLDNYTRRGSFDDRTLVIARLKEGRT